MYLQYFICNPTLKREEFSEGVSDNDVDLKISL